MAKKDDKDKKKKPKGTPPPKKKRRVGRPKKRGRKKKYYKKKKKKSKGAQGNKGFGSNVSYNRVRSLLWKEHKNEFASYRDFISNKVDDDGKKIKGSSVVSEVYNECKSLDCSDEDILIIYRQSNEQNEEDVKPELPSHYYEPRPYWQLLTEDLWDGMDERLWVEAPMIIINPSSFLGILGEDRCVGKDNEILPLSQCEIKKGKKVNEDAKQVLGKKNFFQPFVNWNNEVQLTDNVEGMEAESGTVAHVMFIGKNNEKETYWNPEENRWEIELVICTSQGVINDFNFNPSVDDQDIEDYIRPEIKDKEPEPEPEPEPIEEKSTAVEKAEIEEIRKTGELTQKKVKVDILEAKKKGIMEEGRFFKDIGDKKGLADAVKRLKDINKQIDKIKVI